MPPQDDAVLSCLIASDQIASGYDASSAAPQSSRHAETSCTALAQLAPFLNSGKRDHQSQLDPGKQRSRSSSVRFQAEPAPPSYHLLAALHADSTSFTLPSAVSAETAAQAFALAPKALHFSQTRSVAPRASRTAPGMTSTQTAPTVIDCVSEFSGIGALEHGLQEGFREAGLILRLIQCSELDSTTFGRHNMAVLKKRFPGVEVLNPGERSVRPIPASTSMVCVTTLCQNHSKLNSDRSPWETDELLKPVFDRIKSATGVQVLLMEK